MAFNSRMHPRNIYKKPPDFKALAIQYPEFRKYVKQELSGRLSLDYNNRKAVMELTKVLLLNDFNLRVEINEDRLIPRVPLCLNYVLWVEDLLSNLKRKDVRGIDIGTGSVCIYSLLGATKGWNMLATEIDQTSYKNAIENVNKNNLNDKITIKLTNDPNKLLVGVIDENLSYDFCMCNPPFFDINEKKCNRTRKRKIIDTVASYVNTDVVTIGGEFGFIKRLIEESRYLGDKVKIYTTLIGKKCDLLSLKKEISKVNPSSMIDAEFCQGKTTRWALAWSFSDVKLEKEKIEKPKKPELKYFQFFISGGNYDLKNTSEKVENMLKDLKIAYTVEWISGNYIFSLKAYLNTWSHQRQKKRLNKKQKITCDPEELDSNVPGDNDTSSENSSAKKIILNEDLNVKTNTPTLSKELLVECLLSLRQIDMNIELKFSWLSGDKECVHQIFQYFKNKWKHTNEKNVIEESAGEV